MRLLEGVFEEILRIRPRPSGEKGAMLSINADNKFVTACLDLKQLIKLQRALTRHIRAEKGRTS